MPQLIDYIDKIARDNNRDVLYLVFKQQPSDCEIPFDYQSSKRRQQVIEWLDANNMTYFPCAGPATVEEGIGSYSGFLYVDVPFEEGDVEFKKLSAYFEHPDGTSRYDDMIFAYYPLEKALENKHHDEPGFWDKWFEERGF
jgi:hypothetical protein